MLRAYLNAYAKVSSLAEGLNLVSISRGSHRLEKFLNLEGFLEKSLQIKLVLKSTVKSQKSHEKFLNSTIFCRT